MCEPDVSTTALSMDEEASEMDQKAPRLGNCEVCAVKPAKYTCPKCELKTCCLNCVNIHKKELDCDGVRNPVKFVTMQKFSNLELQNDFNLLEQVSNSLFKYKRDPVKNSVLVYNQLPFSLHLLRKFAYMKKTQLKFLPKLFTKHKINTSCVIKKKLFWRVEWVFVSANIKYSDDKLIDSTRMCLAIKTHLEKPELALYKSAGINRLVILMKVERSTKFYMLDNTLSIAENLKNKCVLEFPVFYVLFNYEKDMFDIQELDDRSITNIQISNPTIAESDKFDCTDQYEHDESESLCIPKESDEIVSIPDSTDDSNYSSIMYEYDY